MLSFLLLFAKENYVDLANVDNDSQEHIYQSVVRMLNFFQFNEKALLVRNYTTQAALMVPDNSIDFIYIDARHDYCGCYEDIVTWWPKLKIGGVMSGIVWLFLILNMYTYFSIQ